MCEIPDWMFCTDQFWQSITSSAPDLSFPRIKLMQGSVWLLMKVSWLNNVLPCEKAYKGRPMQCHNEQKTKTVFFGSETLQEDLHDDGWWCFFLFLWRWWWWWEVLDHMSGWVTVWEPGMQQIGKLSLFQKIIIQKYFNQMFWFYSLIEK